MLINIHGRWRNMYSSRMDWEKWTYGLCIVWTNNWSCTASKKKKKILRTWLAWKALHNSISSCFFHSLFNQWYISLIEQTGSNECLPKTLQQKSPFVSTFVALSAKRKKIVKKIIFLPNYIFVTVYSLLWFQTSMTHGVSLYMQVLTVILWNNVTI